MVFGANVAIHTGSCVAFAMVGRILSDPQLFGVRIAKAIEGLKASYRRRYVAYHRMEFDSEPTTF